MSCEGNRHKYFQLMAGQGADAQALERLYQAAYNRPAENAAVTLQAEAKTRLLFAEMQRNGLHPPTHSPTGLPKPEAQQGYAAVYDALIRDGLIKPAISAPKSMSLTQATNPSQPATHLSVREWAEVCTPDGRDADGFDRLGYNSQGFNRDDSDRFGYNPSGFDVRGYNRHGFNKKGVDKDGYNAAGYNANLRDREGFDLYGVDANGRDRDGYDQHGYDAQGFDRAGFDQNGYDRNGIRHPFFTPDASGIYTDSRDAWGFDAEGYDLDGRDRFGFDRQGYNLSGTTGMVGAAMGAMSRASIRRATTLTGIASKVNAGSTGWAMTEMASTPGASPSPGLTRMAWTAEGSCACARTSAAGRLRLNTVTDGTPMATIAGGSTKTPA